MQRGWEAKRGRRDTAWGTKPLHCSLPLCPGRALDTRQRGLRTLGPWGGRWLLLEAHHRANPGPSDPPAQTQLVQAIPVYPFLIWAPAPLRLP